MSPEDYRDKPSWRDLQRRPGAREEGTGVSGRSNRWALLVACCWVFIAVVVIIYLLMFVFHWG
jgi:hypothetical protein